MGGAVSSGRDNNELVDNLMSGNYIRSRVVERVFRVLDRADYMSSESRDEAYKDLAWRNGPLHLSAPCIYSEVMEALELKPGLSFLNIGSGTGYLSTLVGLIIGSSGISHGIEAHSVVTEYANKKLAQFVENSITLDEYDYCMPKYYTGNGLCLAPTHTYDRVYCGAGVLSKHEDYFRHLIKVGGVLVMPLADTLVQLRRVSEEHWSKRNLLNVSFALLREPAKEERRELIKLEEQAPPSLQVLSRAAIRRAVREGLCGRHRDLAEPPPRTLPAPRHAPRRICIPIQAESDEELNELHDLDEEGGAHEMNALLNLVLSMGQNRAAGSLRVDPVDDEYDDEYADYDDIVQLHADFDAVGPDRQERPDRPERPPRPDRAERPDRPERRERPDRPTLPVLGPDGGVIVVDVAGIRTRRWSGLSSPPAPGTSHPDRESGPVTRSKAAAKLKTVAGLKTKSKSTKTKIAAKAGRKPETRSKTLMKNKTNGKSKTELKTRKAAKCGMSTESDASPMSGSSSTDAERSAAPALWREDSSADEDMQMKESKRQKLDSGIGEGASSGASPDKIDDTDASDGSNDGDTSDKDTDMGWGDVGDTSNSYSSSEEEGGRARGARGAASEGVLSDLKRRRFERERARSEGPAKRTAHARGGSGSSADSSGSGSGSGSGAAGGGRDARRLRLSLAMKRAVAELPLPQPLKKFVNFGRCIQF